MGRPADAIFVQGADNDDTPDRAGGTGRFSRGALRPRLPDQLPRCIFCGCASRPPDPRLTMTNFMSSPTTTAVTYLHQGAAARAAPGGHAPPPFPMSEGMEERDYYQGKVASASDTQRAYVEEYAASAPTVEEETAQ